MIGVVVPAHNEEDSIRACLASILEASCDPHLAQEPVRVFVVLDCCTDDTQPIAEGMPGDETVWGVGASEAPGGRVSFAPTTADGAVLLNGVKHWCSGARGASHALLTVWPGEAQQPNDAPQLVWLPIHQPGVHVIADTWKAVGMNGSASLQVQLTGVRAWLVGSLGQYLSRPGFWQGGAGVAACWYGGTATLAKTLYRAVADRPKCIGSGCPTAKWPAISRRCNPNWRSACGGATSS